MTVNVQSGAGQPQHNRLAMTAVETVLRYFQAAMRRRAQYARLRRMHDQMYAVSDHTLKDIGLVRSELTSVVSDRTGERRRSHVCR